MPIFTSIPSSFYPCTDGSYSDHNRRGACMYHGGLSDSQPVDLSAGKGSGVVLARIDKIMVAHEWFQNRASAYSLRSVQNIIDAAANGSFRWANMDAVTLWKSPGGQLYMISGHSRHEAFIQLCAGQYKAEGKDFCRIPAKIVGGSLEDAKRMALESNTLSTKETDLERAAYYAKQRAAGANVIELEKLAKKLEGRNANTVIGFSYLNPNGITWQSLQALSNGGTDSKSIMATVARWIGNARKSNPALTNGHENELYQWLITDKGYGSGRAQVSRENDFRSRLASIIIRRTTFGKLEERLNIRQHLQRSPVEQQYNKQLEEAKADVQNAEKSLKTKLKSLVDKKASDKDIARITEPLEIALRRARTRYQQLISKAGDVQAAAAREQSLFSSLGGFPVRRMFSI